MTYQVLARKWRPQDFSSIVGQEPIVTALRNALIDGRIAQAYLFSGIRGVGKTTAARVFAKALNCERGPAADPCNACPICHDITTGHDLDTIEVDAATYSKVEQVRELTESLRYGPARNRYKVVVLDEVHRLSRQAFDALLKIVEEPPPHLVFIFATTEIDAVPATILSRCQEFQFRRVPTPALAEHLRRICAHENLLASDTALRWIARAGEGSVRDAVALLDQLATFGGGKVEEQAAKSLLGGLDAALFARLLGAILAGDTRAVVALVQEIECQGFDPHHVYSQFLTYLRAALHLALGGAAAVVDLPSEEAATLSALVAPHGYENLLRLLQLLLASEPTVRRSEFALLGLEIAWLRAAELPRVTRIEEFLAGRIPPGRPAPETAARTLPAPPPAAREFRSPPVPPPVSEDASPGSSAASAEVAGEDPRLAQLLAELRQRNPRFALTFNHARLVFQRGALKIQSAPDPVLESALKQPKNDELLTELVTRLFGPAAAWQLVLARAAAASPAPASAPNPSRGTDPRGTDPRGTDPREADPLGQRLAATTPPRGPSSPAPAAGTGRSQEHPAVQAVLDIFNTSVQSSRSG